MTFDRPLIVLDLESTGTDPVNDRIVELSFVKKRVDGTVAMACTRFNPGMHISDGATAVHGITDADVASAPKFSDVAAKIHAVLKGCDLAGYNLRRLDLPILDEEFRRCGLYLDLTGVRILDAFAIFQKKHPRDLEAAVKHYCGKEHTGAHSSLADAQATLAVLEAQLVQHEDLGAMDLNHLDVYCARREDGTRPADIAGKLYWDADNNLRYNFGAKRGTLVMEDVGLATWMLGKDFPASTKELLRAYLSENDLVNA